MSQYILIPRIEVKNANAQPAWWIIGPPPLTAYAGFAQALALAICRDKDDRKGQLHEGVAIIHHDIQFLGEAAYLYGINTLSPHQYRAASFIGKKDYVKPKKGEKKRPVLSSQPTARCHLAVSLVIKFDDDFSFRLADVDKFLRGARLAGGAIIEHGKVENIEDIDSVTKKVGSGFSIVERQDLMTLQQNDNDMLDVILRMTKPVNPKERTDDQKWLLPTTLGYVEITERKRRRNVRGDMPHAYAEPLVGLIQYKSIRDAGLQFWRYTHPQPNAHTVSTI